MYVYSFEKLEVWKESRELTKSIYAVSSKFPDSELFGLTQQIRRSMLSVTSNISEGSGRSSKKEQNHFYNIAYGSLLEVLNQLIISVDLGYLDSLTYSDELRPKIESISKMLYALKTRQ